MATNLDAIMYLKEPSTFSQLYPMVSPKGREPLQPAYSTIKNKPKFLFTFTYLKPDADSTTKSLNLGETQQKSQMEQRGKLGVLGVASGVIQWDMTNTLQGNQLISKAPQPSGTGGHDCQ